MGTLGQVLKKHGTVEKVERVRASGGSLISKRSQLKGHGGVSGIRAAPGGCQLGMM